MNDSTTGGVLLPVADADQTGLRRAIQQALSAITGIPGTLVRPRWQQTPPNIPDYGTDWVAFGITVRKPDTNAVIQHVGDTDGADIVQRQVEMDMLFSFYGPNADEMAERLIQGAQIPQNWESLRSLDVQFVASGDPLTVPELLKEQWLYRVDVELTFRRYLTNQYPVKNLQAALIELFTELEEVTILVIPNLQVAAAEIPQGAIDGNNTIFTLHAPPNPAGSLQLFMDAGVGTGLALQRQGEDYTLAGNVLTFTVAPPVGSRLLAWYFF